MIDYNGYKDLVEKHLLDFIPQTDIKARTLFESMKYSLMSGGKRLRPVLLLAACDFTGTDVYEALPYACALEYIHTYSLIHDDLPAMDDDDLRRGNPTNHKVYGEATAVLAGDALLNTACEVMFRDLTYFFDDAKKLKCHIKAGLAIIKAAGINGMIAGQLCDIETEFCECSLEMVKYIDANKTGALLTAPIVAGLSIGNADKNTCAAFRQYAECIGQAFQISDDILDKTGKENEVGKKLGKDEEKGKANFVVVNGIKAAEDELHRLTKQAETALKDVKKDTTFFIELARKLEHRRA